MPATIAEEYGIVTFLDPGWSYPPRIQGERLDLVAVQQLQHPVTHAGHVAREERVDARDAGVPLHPRAVHLVHHDRSSLPRQALHGRADLLADAGAARIPGQRDLVERTQNRLDYYAGADPLFTAESSVVGRYSIDFTGFPESRINGPYALVLDQWTGSITGPYHCAVHTLPGTGMR
jgi:hypothetical protein